MHREGYERIFMNVFINGESKSVPDSLTMTALLQHLQLNPRLVAVEYNGDILHRQHWEDTAISEGDRLEIVTMVGGG